MHPLPILTAVTAVVVTVWLLISSQANSLLTSPLVCTHLDLNHVALRVVGTNNRVDAKVCKTYRHKTTWAIISMTHIHLLEASVASAFTLQQKGWIIVHNRQFFLKEQLGTWCNFQEVIINILCFAAPTSGSIFSSSVIATVTSPFLLALQLRLMYSRKSLINYLNLHLSFWQLQVTNRTEETSHFVTIQNSYLLVIH